MNSYKNNNFLKKVPGWSIGLILGIVFLMVGVTLEQHTDIFQKARMICLECIGIG